MDDDDHQDDNDNDDDMIVIMGAPPGAAGGRWGYYCGVYWRVLGVMSYDFVMLLKASLLHLLC